MRLGRKADSSQRQYRLGVVAVAVFYDEARLLRRDLQGAAVACHVKSASKVSFHALHVVMPALPGLLRGILLSHLSHQAPIHCCPEACIRAICMI